MLKTLKGRTALAAALLAAIGIAGVTRLQSSMSERSVIASTVRQHEIYTARVANEIDNRMRLARAALSEFASNVPGNQLGNANTLQPYLASRAGLQPTFESIAVYDTQGQLIASRPAIPNTSIAQEPWFRDSLVKAVVGPPSHSKLSREPAVSVTYRVYDEAGQMRGVAVGTMPINHEQLFSAAHDAVRGHFVLVTPDAKVVLHPDSEMVGQSIKALGPVADIIRAGLKDEAPSVTGLDGSGGARSLYAFRRVSSTGWILVGVANNEEAYASLDQLSRQMLLAGGLLALLLIPAMWLLVARMLLPLDELRLDIRRLKEGGALTGPQRRRRDVTQELQQVAEEFAGMAAARHLAEASLKQEKQRAEVTLQSIGDAVLATDREGRVTAMNKTAERLTGWTLQEALGRPFGEVVHLCDETGDHQPLGNLAVQAMNDGVIVSMKGAVLRRRDGDLLASDNSAAPIHSAEGTIDGAVVVLRNVAVERAAAQELAWRATHDAMTGLANRGAYEQALKHLAEGLLEGHEHSVVMIDLDKFKAVNDTCGHAAGDELLKQLAVLFLGLTRKTDLFARLGGDEFAVLMYQCTLEHALLLAEKLRRAVDEWRFHWEGQTFRVSASIGIVFVDRQFSDAIAIQKAADEACYTAKRSGRNRICVHADGVRSLAAEARARPGRVPDVQEAIDAGRLVLLGQAALACGEPGPRPGPHLEVTVRLLDEHGEPTAPQEFLSAAEHQGTAELLDRWVLEQAIRTCAERFGPDRWDELGMVQLTLSASSWQDAGLGDFIAQTLQRHAMPAACLCLVVSETAVTERWLSSCERLHGLRALGIRIALGSFGLGMTPLSKWPDLPVDWLKIDGSFVQGIKGHALHAEMVEAIQRIARRLGLRTWASGIVDADDLACLKRLGVQDLQGDALVPAAPLRVALERDSRCAEPVA